MVKIIVTLTAAVAAAAILADVSSSEPMPLFSKHLRDEVSSSGDVGFGTASDDVPPPHDFSRDFAPSQDTMDGIDGEHGESLQDGHHPPSPDVGSLDVPGDPKEAGLYHGSGSVDSRFPPPSDAGSGVSDIPDRDNFGQSHRKAQAFVNDKPDDHRPSEADKPRMKFPHHGSDMDASSWQGSGSVDGRFPPPPNAGDEPASPFPGHDQGGIYHKPLENEAPEAQNSSSPQGSDDTKPTVAPGQDESHGSNDGHNQKNNHDGIPEELAKPDEKQPPVAPPSGGEQMPPVQGQERYPNAGAPIGEGKSGEESKLTGDNKPAENDKPAGKPTENDKPKDDNKPSGDGKPTGNGITHAGGERSFGSGIKRAGGDNRNKFIGDKHVGNDTPSGDREDVPGRQGNSLNGSHYGAGSGGGQFPPPPNVGSDEKPPAPDREHADSDLETLTNGDKPDGRISPPSQAGSGSVFPVHVLGAGSEGLAHMVEKPQ